MCANIIHPFTRQASVHREDHNWDVRAKHRCLNSNCKMFNNSMYRDRHYTLLSSVSQTFRCCHELHRKSKTLTFHSEIQTLMHKTELSVGLKAGFFFFFK